MLYLTLFLTGFLIDRYGLPVFDLLYELLNHRLSGMVQGESIKSKRAELLFQKEMGADVVDGNEPRIGFQYPVDVEGIEEEDEDED